MGDRLVVFIRSPFLLTQAGYGYTHRKRQRPCVDVSLLAVIFSTTRYLSSPFYWHWTFERRGIVT